jgi:hypothetical protein
MGWAVVDLFLVASGLASKPRYLIEDYSGYDDYRYIYDPSKVTPEDAQLEKDIMGKGQALVAFVSFTMWVTITRLQTFAEIFLTSGGAYLGSYILCCSSSPATKPTSGTECRGPST